MTGFTLYIPTHNDSQAAIQSVQSAPDWRIIVVDNNSEPEHREAIASLASPRVKVVLHNQDIGRVNNWQWCVRDFLASNATWFKMLAAGDRLKPDALDRFRYLMGTASGMTLFVPGVEHVGGESESGHWYWTDRPAIYDPVQALRAAACRGNIWHSLSAAFIHRAALERCAWTFGEGALTFCADMLFMASLAKHSPSHFDRLPLVERIIRHRKTYGVEFDSPNAILEESLVRLRCAQFATDLDGDQEALDRLTQRITDWTIKQCTRVLNHATTSC